MDMNHGLELLENYSNQLQYIRKKCMIKQDKILQLTLTQMVKLSHVLQFI